MKESKLSQEVLKKIKPTKKEIELQKKIEAEIIERIMKVKGKHLKVMLCGSSARNTHLRNDNDLDFFVFFPKEMKRQEFEKEGLRVAKKALKGFEFLEEFAEHPYIRGKYKGFNVEIIPTYNVEKAEMLQSAVDRSPFHMQYLEKKLNEKLCDEIRLFKAFLKGIDAYGAKLKVTSMPGYLTELLVLNYGSFLETIKAISEWHKFEVIDIEGYYPIKEDAIKKFNHHLIVVDPTDKNRNVAAAVSYNQFARIIAASRRFLEKPSKYFFFGKKIRLMSEKKVKEKLKQKELLVMEMPYPKKAHIEVVYGQLKRLKEKIRKQLLLNDFDVIRISEFTNEKDLIIFIIDTTFLEIEKVKRKEGPEVVDYNNSKAFLEKHKRVVLGPRIEEGRWIIEVKRKNYNAAKFLVEYWKKERKKERQPLKNVLGKIRVYQKDEAIHLFKRDKKFAEFLSDFLRGIERFLYY